MFNIKLLIVLILLPFITSCVGPIAGILKEDQSLQGPDPIMEIDNGVFIKKGSIEYIDLNKLFDRANTFMPEGKIEKISTWDQGFQHINSYIEENSIDTIGQMRIRNRIQERIIAASN